MVAWWIVCSYNDTLCGCHLGVRVSVSTKHNKALTSWNLFLSVVCLSLPPSLLLDVSSSSGYVLLSVPLSFHLFLSLFLSHFFPLTITPRSCAANKSSRPSKWHLNVNAASDVPKPPQCTVSLPTISSVALCHGFCVLIYWRYIHISVSSYISK